MRDDHPRLKRIGAFALPNVLDNEFVRQTVIAVAADLALFDITRQPGAAGNQRRRVMKRRVKTDDMMRIRQAQSRGDNSVQVGWQVERRQRNKPAQPRLQLRRHRFRAVAIRSAMDHSVSDKVDGANLFGAFQPVHGAVDRRRMVDAWRFFIPQDRAVSIGGVRAGIVGADIGHRAGQDTARLGLSAEGREFQTRRAAIQGQDDAIARNSRHQALVANTIKIPPERVVIGDVNLGGGVNLGHLTLRHYLHAGALEAKTSMVAARADYKASQTVAHWRCHGRCARA